MWDLANFVHGTKAIWQELLILQASPDSRAVTVIQDVKTRWNSEFYMMRRMLRLLPFLEKMLEDGRFPELALVALNPDTIARVKSYVKVCCNWLLTDKGATTFGEVYKIF